MIRHHPSEPTLAAYAAGSLPQALALVAATHLGRCATCRDSLAMLEATGGALLEDLPPAPLSIDALDQVLARLDESPPPPLPVIASDLPAPLNRVAVGRWWPVGLATWYRPLHVPGSAWGGLLLAQPGRALPRHGHKGLELTCVLSGAFADGSGEYAAGDLSEPVTDHDQPPIAIGAAPCLCVIASEGMSMRGLLGVAQRMFGP